MAHEMGGGMQTPTGGARREHGRMDDLRGFAETRDSITDVWGPRAPYRGEGQWPARVDERVQAGVTPDAWVPSACVLCSNGCACEIAVKDGRMVGVRGRAGDHVNRGRLGPKGLHAWIANHSPERLTRPQIRGRDGRLHDASWDEAMDLIVRKVKETVKDYTVGALGFYNSGQLFLEEYYTLTLVVHGGLGTRNMDGNTRLCTATAAAALKESFGSDGQPASYADVDETDCFFLVGHNVAATQTVLWARMLDRRRGPNPPKMVVVDPRETEPAREADVHLAPRVGTNVAVLNGLLNLIIGMGAVDRDFVARHTVGYEALVETVASYPPDVVESLSGVPAARLRAAAEILARAPRLLSTVLQGVYQSHQATAAAVQVNNINLIRGLIGRPGSGVLQMNGQPTAQNTRECGADGEFPAFLNADNPAHMRRLARHWNIAEDAYPHWTEPTHAMGMMRRAEQGSIRFLWVMATNPAVSMPELHRIRRILGKDQLFLVVQDAFPTETTALADVVLPAAIWGEKTGTFTNADRTVHVSRQAIRPPGQAKADLDILIDFARRMGLKDKDGQDLVKWGDAEGAFAHWKALTTGRLCDYSGLTYEKLAEGGVRWPCHERAPQGTPRLYSDHVFPTAADVCQEFGHDLLTGGKISPEEYAAHDPGGRARLKAAHYVPYVEAPDAAFPWLLTTGRRTLQFHTRTKTGRSLSLHDAAPDVFVQLAPEDAKRLGIAEGETVAVTTRHGHMEGPARIGGIPPGQVFVPFHYGYWDADGRAHRAANELTRTTWDPVSKQPIFKVAAALVHKPGQASLASAVGSAAGTMAERAKEVVDGVKSKAHVPRAHLADYLGLLTQAAGVFAQSCRELAQHHAAEDDVAQSAKLLAHEADMLVAALSPFVSAYGATAPRAPAKVKDGALAHAHAGTFGLVRDLHGLMVVRSDLHAALTGVGIAARELRDHGLERVCDRYKEEDAKHLRWLETQFKARIGQALTVPQ